MENYKDDITYLPILNQDLHDLYKSTTDGTKSGWDLQGDIEEISQKRPTNGFIKQEFKDGKVNLYKTADFWTPLSISNTVREFSIYVSGCRLYHFGEKILSLFEKEDCTYDLSPFNIYIPLFLANLQDYRVEIEMENSDGTDPVLESRYSFLSNKEKCDFINKHENTHFTILTKHFITIQTDKNLKNYYNVRTDIVEKRNEFSEPIHLSFLEKDGECIVSKEKIPFFDTPDLFTLTYAEYDQIVYYNELCGKMYG